jgi:hypothetical protein
VNWFRRAINRDLVTISCSCESRPQATGASRGICAGVSRRKPFLLERDRNVLPVLSLVQFQLAFFAGYSIGKWIDTDGDGRYDVLEVETRDLKGPRAYDGTGLPLHEDNETVIKERLYTDKADPNIIINEITTIDNALRRPWTAIKKYRRVATTEEAV